MKRNIGLWIDHRKTVIVKIIDKTEEIHFLESDMEKHVRFSGGAEKDSEEDQRDRRFKNHLNKYYDEVIFLISDAKSIFIIGPGEAKVEFKKRLENKMNAGMAIDLETADKMTDKQIAAKVRNHFDS